VSPNGNALTAERTGGGCSELAVVSGGNGLEERER
jgi:hypothetical protein